MLRTDKILEVPQVNGSYEEAEKEVSHQQRLRQVLKSQLNGKNLAKGGDKTTDIKTKSTSEHIEGFTPSPASSEHI